jgi:pyruvate/2-oxoglutarate dehydrogenase complex dihydrolipoamide dehydrogenase (E3) component
VPYVTSDTVWDLATLPGRLVVLGGGPIGCELAQAFARLGSRVTIVEQAEQLLPAEDSDVARAVTKQFTAEAIEVLCGHRVVRFARDDDAAQAVVTSGADERAIPFDQVLLATGRRANVDGYGLEELELPVNANGTLAVDAYLQTRYPSIFACGDIIGPYQFTHMAAYQAWYAAFNALFGGIRKSKVNYSVVPWAVFVDPEVARVGLNEREAAARGVPFEVVRYELSDLDRAITDGEARGFVKVLTPPGKDRILGAVIVGSHAAEGIHEYVLAMTHGLGLKKMLSTIHVYPTFAESARHTAGVWRQRHLPARIQPWLERWHRWRRRQRKG